MLKDYILLVDKPAGITSQQVISIIKKKLNIKKIGHTGTLDPIATGLMVVLINEATKLSNLILTLDKTYVAEMKLFVKTDTGDITGQVINIQSPFLISEKQISEAFNKYDNLVYEQDIPLYSAVKINGQKLYEYARKKQSVNLPKREVTIKKINVLNYQKGVIKFEVSCSKGTYIRSLINDLAVQLNTIATMQSLVRTKQNNFSIEDSLTIDKINIENVVKKQLSIFNVLSCFFKTINISEEKQLFKIKNGQKIFINDSFLDKEVLLVNNNQVLAIYQRTENNIFVSKRGFNFDGN